MSSRYSTNQRRRPLSTGEVGLFVCLVVIVFGFGVYRPGGATNASTGQSGLALMNVLTDEAIQDTPGIAGAPAIDLAGTPLPAAPVADVQIDAQTGGEETMTFDGRPLRKVKQMTMLTTAYSPDARSCGKWADGYTASGYSVWTNGMKLVAADTRILPFGTLVTIPGYNGGRPVPVLDRGGKIKGNRLDLLYPTHDIALQWGAQRLAVDVWEYAD